ncbi:MAG: 30S ribosomal protein S17 [Flavobacteriales bacterium]|jgi:small subunit ribosomal protein S17|uniref:30S ribosomal protein S17 n=1 Tax=Blattabacterium sp. (Mastotermes darwiniensis) TaxID=39768 RepID=UPI000231DE6A|nr:30S ribosomal protein S17 [Blattabacterium sp. (Mastotermes darwiniensis)]AER40670.1 30S ribosomal protein S17 [Blattabacterium sp. (Mastotermes darwiniensis) str. MADAR]MDR1804802.1 30S ribosomal protein S17 [Flavobacteriales bacterium]
MIKEEKKKDFGSSSVRAPRRKERVGIVTSDKMNKTIIVSEIKKMKHKYYGKSILKKKKYMVHDERNTSKNGDIVSIMETRPISKNKCWRLVSIIKK